MASDFLTPDEYVNPNPSTGYKLMRLKTQNEKRSQARKAWEVLSNFQRDSVDRKASELRKLYKEIHPSPKKLQSPYILFFTQESKKFRDAEGMQMCPLLVKRLSATWKHMSEEETKSYVDEVRRLKKAHDIVRKTRSKPAFNAGYGFSWAKILGPDGLRTLELD